MRYTSQATSPLFTTAHFPELVFGSAVTGCTWVYMDDLCCAYGWALLSALARQHGDTSVQAIGFDLVEPEVLTLQIDADEDAYGAVCDDKLFAPSVIRWWSPNGHWAIHGSRDFEIAVVGQVDSAPWPRSRNCDILSIDGAIRLARLARVHDDLLAEMMANYDALSWDPALGNESAVAELVDACRDVLAARIDPIVGMRQIVKRLYVAPKEIRRIPAVAQLYKASGRTGYLAVGGEREEFGRKYGLGLLAQNDRNHERHAREERSVVRSAAEEIASAIERMR